MKQMELIELKEDWLVICRRKQPINSLHFSLRMRNEVLLMELIALASLVD